MAVLASTIVRQPTQSKDLQGAVARVKRELTRWPNGECRLRTTVADNESRSRISRLGLRIVKTRQAIKTLFQANFDF